MAPECGYAVIGIDPGMNGGIALINDRLCKAFPMPIIDGAIDCNEIDSMIHAFLPKIIYIEKVHSMPKQGVASTFKFGMGYGKILGVLESSIFDYEQVTPQAWMKKLGLKKIDKTDKPSVAYVQEHYGSVCLTPGRKTKPHDGMADAICIAEYGRMMHV